MAAVGILAFDTVELVGWADVNVAPELMLLNVKFPDMKELVGEGVELIMLELPIPDVVFEKSGAVDPELMVLNVLMLDAIEVAGEVDTVTDPVLRALLIEVVAIDVVGRELWGTTVKEIGKTRLIPRAPERT